MSDRDVIAEALEGYSIGSGSDAVVDSESAQALAYEVHEALRESRTVRTVKELDALPVGTVIHASGYTYELIEHTYTRDGLPTREWACAGWPGRTPGDDWDASELARVLHRPDEDGAL